LGKGSKMEIPKRPIEAWLKIYRTEGTRGAYRTSIRSFLEYIYEKNLTEKISDAPPTKKVPVSKEVQKEFEKLARKYLKEERDYYRDIRDFVIYLRDEEEYAPKTQKYYLVGVKQFFIEYELEIKRIRWKKLQKMKDKTRPIIKDRRPTKEELKQILTHLPLRGRALVYTLASSGMRQGEVMQVTEDHVHFEETPTRIELEPEWAKKGGGRDVFISREASQELKNGLSLKRVGGIRQELRKKYRGK